MKRLFAALAVLFCMATVFAQQTITVTNVKDFIKAIGSNRTIELKAGTYTLSEAYGVVNQSIKWEKKSQGNELVLVNVKNLVIKGGGSTIVATSPYCEVMRLRGSENISLQDVVLSHTVQGPCGSGVLFVEDSTGVTLSNCTLDGSGAIGVTLMGSADFYMEHGAVSNCTYGLIDAESSEGITFYDVSFEGNFDLGTALYASEVYGMTFDSCTFFDNSGSTFMWFEGEDISFVYCYIGGNVFEILTDSDFTPLMADCSYEENTFDEELGYLMEYYEDDGMPVTYYDYMPAGLTFYYPVWYEEEERQDNILHLFDSESGIDFYVFELFSLTARDDADTQFEALAKRAMLGMLKPSGVLQIKNFKVTMVNEINTEAPPYYYFATATLNIGGINKQAIFKIVHAKGKLWLFLLVADDVSQLEDSLDTVSLSSIEALEE